MRVPRVDVQPALEGRLILEIHLLAALQLWRHKRASNVFEPIDLEAMASPILTASPARRSPLVVAKCNKSGRYVVSHELRVKSAPHPPLARITGTKILETDTTLLIDTTSACNSDPCFGDYHRLVVLLGNLLKHLSQSIGDGHAWETLLPWVGCEG